MENGEDDAMEPHSDEQIDLAICLESLLDVSRDLEIVFLCIAPHEKMVIRKNVFLMDRMAEQKNFVSFLQKEGDDSSDVLLLMGKVSSPQGDADSQSRLRSIRQMPALRLCGRIPEEYGVAQESRRNGDAPQNPLAIPITHAYECPSSAEQISQILCFPFRIAYPHTHPHDLLKEQLREEDSEFPLLQWCHSFLNLLLIDQSSSSKDDEIGFRDRDHRFPEMGKIPERSLLEIRGKIRDIADIGRRIEQGALRIIGEDGECRIRETSLEKLILLLEDELISQILMSGSSEERDSHGSAISITSLWRKPSSPSDPIPLQESISRPLQPFSCRITSR